MFVTICNIKVIQYLKTELNVSRKIVLLSATQVYLYIYLFIVSHSHWKRSLREWSQQKSLYLSLSTHSLVCSNPPPSISTSFMHVLFYPILPSYNYYSLLLLGPSVSLAYTFFTNLSLSQSIVFHLFYNTTLRSICIRYHATSFIHAFIALTLPSCHVTCSFQITHFHSLYIWLMYPIPIPSLIHMSVLAGEYCSLTLFYLSQPCLLFLLLSAHVCITQFPYT